MNITITRDVFGADYTLGRLEINGVHHCYTCEDADRGLESEMSDEAIRLRKVRGRTAIPTGQYRMKRTWSPKYKRDMMLLENVPGYRGIRVHSGNRHEHTEGCVLPGEKRDKQRGLVLKSRLACNALDAIVVAALESREEIWVTIKRAA